MSHDQHGRGISWASPEFGLDPYPLLDAHRKEQLAYDSTSEGWVALRHADIVEILSSPVFAKDPRKAIDGPYTTMQRAMAGSSLMFMDDPDRKRLRGLATRAFTRKRVDALRPQVESIAQRLLDAVADAPTFDLMTAYAMPLSVAVIATLLGVGDADHDQFKKWSEDLELEYDPAQSPEDVDRIARSRDELVLYFIGEIDAREQHPGDDLITALVQAHDQRDKLSLEELVSTLVMLLVAGNVTTTDLIGNGVLALLEHPDQLDRLRRDRTLLPNAVEEILRYDSPVTVTDRIATRDLEVSGCPIRKGEWVWPALISANRDPDVHPDPDEFDIARERIQHVSFGVGSHLCLGAELARIEAQIAIDVLLNRFPHLSLDPDASARRHATPAFRGISELPVRVRATDGPC